MKDYSNYRPPVQDHLYWSAIKLFDHQLDLEGNNVSVDGIPTRAIIQTHSNPYNELKEDRKFLCKTDVDINKGSIVDYDNKKWLVFNEVKTNEVYKFSRILQCTHTLNVYKNSVLYKLPAIVESSIQLYRMSLDESKYITIPDDVIIVRVSNNDVASQIKLNDIYQLSEDEHYKVTNINKTIEPGIIVIKMETSQRKQVIPVDTIPPPKGLYLKVNGDDSIVKGKSNNYTAIFFSGDTIISDIATFYITADDGVSATTLASITSQENNMCIVKGNDFGYVKLFAKNADGSVISDGIYIQIKNWF